MPVEDIAAILRKEAKLADAAEEFVDDIASRLYK